MTTQCYADGIRLWEDAKTLRASPSAQGAVGKTGQSRVRGLLDNRSPNHLYEIAVRTTIPPVTQIDAVYGRQATHHLYNLQTQKLLVEASRANLFLSWVVDDALINSVTGGPFTGASQVVTLTDYSGFTPLNGTYYLLRNPTTGEGIVAQCGAVGAGAPYTMALDLVRTGLDRTSEDVTVTSAWKVYPVAYHFPMCQFVRTLWPEVDGQGLDRHSFDVQWLFRSSAHAVWAAAADLDLS